MNCHGHKEENEPLHLVTPLKYSKALSKLIPGATEVYMKMENCQPSGSFKSRGIGKLARKIVGSSYSITEEIALKEAEKPGCGFLSPYDHPEVWAGNSTLVEELKVQLPSKPSTIVLSVGGGGLLLGVMKGLERVGWQDIPVVAMETFGAHCFNLSVKAKKIVALDTITSVAKCLGARTVAPHLLEILPQYSIISEVVTDAQAIESCIKFADDERMLVEPGCGATLSAVYCGILEKLQAEGFLPDLTSGPIVVIVCGGNGVSLSLLQEWAASFNVEFPSP